ncbi:hypothetical protein BHM03_00014514 [Ensete ventricosum]|nr:hypothetical protein BHM03_00014514 [Ensete ventricosum]
MVPPVPGSTYRFANRTVCELLATSDTIDWGCFCPDFDHRRPHGISRGRRKKRKKKRKNLKIWHRSLSTSQSVAAPSHRSSGACRLGVVGDFSSTRGEEAARGEENKVSSTHVGRRNKTMKNTIGLRKSCNKYKGRGDEIDPNLRAGIRASLEHQYMYEEGIADLTNNESMTVAVGLCHKESRGRPA